MATQQMFDDHWKSIVGKVKQKFGQISGDDLTRVQGDFDRFVDLVQRKTGQSREQVEQFVEECYADAGSAYQRLADTAGDMASQAGQYVRDSCRTAAATAEQGYDQAREFAEHGYQQARKVVKHHPLESVAMVAGVALIAGVLIGISLSSRR